MYYTGIDLHQKTSFITTGDETGKVIAQANLPNEEMIILRHFKDLGDPTKVVIESMRSWHWLYDLLTAQGIEVIISNPVKTKAIASARIKNDKVDSHNAGPASKIGPDLCGLCEQPEDPGAQGVASSSVQAGPGCDPNEKSDPYPLGQEQYKVSRKRSLWDSRISLPAGDPAT